MSVYVIAEAGVNHNGRLVIARTMVESAARAGADAIKFQTFRADEFAVKGSKAHTMFKQLELPREWHKELKHLANQCGMDFLSSSADKESVDMLCELGVPMLKIASEDVINIDLLEHVNEQRLPVLLSVGMADGEEIGRALSILSGDVTLLHCVSTYPTSPVECNLRRIVTLRGRYGNPVGYSDHTRGIAAASLAVALGARVIEKHFTLDQDLPGPDHWFSATPQELGELVDSVRLADVLLGDGSPGYQRSEEEGRRLYRRSIVARAPITQGQVVCLEHLAYKRPGTGLKPCQRDLILGKTAQRDMPTDYMIMKGDVV